MYSRTAYANYHTMTLGIPCGARADLKCQLPCGMYCRSLSVNDYKSYAYS